VSVSVPVQAQVRGPARAQVLVLEQVPERATESVPG
jgi:hypothetical protein